MKLPLGEKLNSAKGGFAFSLDVVLYIFVSFVASILIAALNLSNTDGAKYISYLVSPIAIIIALAIFFNSASQRPGEVFNFKCHPKYYLIAIMLIFGLLFSLSYLNGYFVALLQLMGYKPRASTIPDYTGFKIIPVIIVIAVIPAICEEAIFRAVILNNTEATCGTVAAVLLNGLTFMLFHGSAEQTIYQFICGCLFALLAIRSGAILPTVLIHFLNNALIIIFNACGWINDSGNLNLPWGINITIIILSAVSFVCAVLLLIFDKKPIKPKREGGVARYFLFASVGMFIMALMWILSLFNI